jgi:hypothetical protein
MRLYFCAFGRHLDTQNIEQKNDRAHTTRERTGCHIKTNQIQKGNSYKLPVFFFFFFSFLSSNIRVK